MGTRYGFRCPECGYFATVSGGLDFGMVAVVRTMVCDDCKEVVDVLVGKYGEEGPTGDLRYDKDLKVCPNCHRRRVRPWSANRNCPRCAASMKLAHDSPKVLWD
jgi:uncharacterized paraquat-inducible protein A